VDSEGERNGSYSSVTQIMIRVSGTHKKDHRLA
jgi:hypothetical protein